MSKRSWKVLFEDMLASVQKIERYTEGLTFEAFLEEEMVADAVVRNLEIIGEAANQLPDEITERFEEISWPQIVGLKSWACEIASSIRTSTWTCTSSGPS